MAKIGSSEARAGQGRDRRTKNNAICIALLTSLLGSTCDEEAKNILPVSKMFVLLQTQIERKNQFFNQSFIKPLFKTAKNSIR